MQKMIRVRQQDRLDSVWESAQPWDPSGDKKYGTLPLTSCAVCTLF